MIQILPLADDGSEAVADIETSVASEARSAHQHRPWVYTNMITSADGGTAVDGLSGPLGGPGDLAVFAALRSAADAILVGAATVREEEYRPPRRSETTRNRRLAEGRRADPRLAVVTRSLDLDPSLPLFGDPTNRPLVITVADAPTGRRRRLEPVAEVIDAGASRVDLDRALRALLASGAETVLSEGGPSLNGQLIEADLIDEWNLTLSPHLLGGDSRRAAVGTTPGGPPRRMKLTRVWADDDFLFCRWLRDQG